MRDGILRFVGGPDASVGSDNHGHSRRKQGHGRSRLQRLLQDYGFTPLQFETETREEARRVQFDASALRASVKALLGVSEFAVSVVARQTAPH